MEAYEQTMVLSLLQVPGKKELKLLDTLKEDMEGIIDITRGNKVLRIAFQPYLVNRNLIEGWIEKRGIQLKREAARKGFIRRFIDSLGDNNERAFGEKRLDCCDLSGDKK